MDRKLFAELKTQCKTKAQRLAFNKLIRSFANCPVKDLDFDPKVRDKAKKLIDDMNNGEYEDDVIADVDENGDKLKDFPPISVQYTDKNGEFTVGRFKNNDPGIFYSVPIPWGGREYHIFFR